MIKPRRTAFIANVKSRQNSVTYEGIQALENTFGQQNLSLVRGKGKYHFHMSLIVNASQLVKQKDDWLW